MNDPRRAIRRDPETYRDFVGYGASLPDPQWPGDALIAVNFNLNIEGGGESCVLSGDCSSEGTLTDVGMPSMRGVRVPYVESTFEYGSRRGLWRTLELFDQAKVPLSILAVVRALECNPEIVPACLARGHEIASHGLRWIDYTEVPPDIERAEIDEAVRTLTRMAGAAPAGWLTGRPSINTRRLALEVGSFEYDRDCLNDELPYWVNVQGKPHLVVPYSLETNDNRLELTHGYSCAEHFFGYMREAFDVLYREGQRGSPKLLSISLHDRLIGRPARSAGLLNLLEYIRGFDRVWFCRGVDIARHWRDRFPPATD